MNDTVEMTCEAVDQRASAALSPSLRDRLVRLAHRFLWNLDDAEDVAHEALIAAHERAEDLRDETKWWSWLCRIVVRRCHQRGREKQRHRRHEESIRLELSRRAGESTTSPSSGSPALLCGLLQELPPRQREVTVLRHLQGMSYEEIADVLGITPSTARVHARAGREALRTLLLERHPEWLDEGPE